MTVQERSVGFVFQHYALFRHMTVRQNVAFGLSVRKESKPAQSKRVDELLKLVQLVHFADRYPDQLSGGQRQRVALARALAPRPEVLLLDEPFGALDARVRQDLRQWLDQLHRELGVTSLLVTHDQEEALELAHSVVVMNEGRVEQIGTPAEVYDVPATPFVAGFVGAANVITGTVISGRVQFGQQLVAEPSTSKTARPLRRTSVRTTCDLPACPPSSPRRSPLLASSNLGWTSKIVLQLPDGQEIQAELPNSEINGLGPGDEMFADLRNAKVFQPDGVAGADRTNWRASNPAVGRPGARSIGRPRRSGSRPGAIPTASERRRRPRRVDPSVSIFATWMSRSRSLSPDVIAYSRPSASGQRTSTTVESADASGNHVDGGNDVAGRPVVARLLFDVSLESEAPEYAASRSRSKSSHAFCLWRLSDETLQREPVGCRIRLGANTEMRLSARTPAARASVPGLSLRADRDDRLSGFGRVVDSVANLTRSGRLQQEPDLVDHVRHGSGVEIGRRERCRAPLRPGPRGSARTTRSRLGARHCIAPPWHFTRFEGYQRLAIELSHQRCLPVAPCRGSRRESVRDREDVELSETLGASDGLGRPLDDVSVVEVAPGRGVREQEVPSDEGRDVFDL